MTSKTSSPPHLRLQVLQRQADKVSVRISKLQELDAKLSNWRLMLFLAVLATTAGSLFLFGETTSWIVLLIGASAFAGVAWLHSKIAAHLRDHQLWHQIKSRQLAKMRLQWQDLPPATVTVHPPEHPYASDLEILGEHSLHRLLNFGTSREGSERLASWLLATRIEPKRLWKRQRQVDELSRLHLFRNKLQLHFSRVSQEALSGHAVETWLNKSAEQKSLRWLLPLLTVLGASTLVLYTLYHFNNTWAFWLWTLLIYIAIYLSNQGPVKMLMHDAVFIDDELTRLRSLLSYLESARLSHAPETLKVLHPLRDHQHQPTQTLRTTRWVSAAIGLRMNPVLAILLNVVFPYDYYCAWLLEQQKRKLRDDLSVWLECIAELDALSALADFTWQNPQSVWPEIAPAADADLLNIVQARHPLLPIDGSVANSIRFAKTGELALITGSNMSGKSTFLKTLGANIVLAFAGAPVLAEKMRVAPLRLYSSLRVSDSLQEGVSFFYAEVKRLKGVLEAAASENEAPVCFLIDEIFRGTNNRERLLGSRAYIDALAKLPAFGCVSTHDLELTQLDQKIAGLRNLHFREHIDAGKMVFDYTLREGPCPTTNALEIMALSGLPVPQEALRPPAIS